MEEIYNCFYRIISGTTAIAAIYIFYKIGSIFKEQKRQRRLTRHFPGPPPHRIWGNLGDMKGGKEGQLQLIEWRKKYGDAFTLWSGPTQAMVTTANPDYVRTILSTSEPKNKLVYENLLDWIGYGLIANNGHTWKRDRRLLTPAFHFDILKAYVGVFSDCANLMATKWRAHLAKPNSGPLEVFTQVSQMTLDSLMKCVMGYHGPSVQMTDGHPYIDTIDGLTDCLVTRLKSPLLRNEFIWRLSPTGRKWRGFCDYAHAFSKSIIDEKRKDLAKTESADINENNHKSTIKRLDFIDMLLRAKDNDGNGLTDEEIQCEMDTFMFAGHDTTASGISWCLYDMAFNQDFQDKCREEIDEVYGDRDELAWDDMTRLPYLTQCIKETFRYHSVVAGVSRTLQNDMKFPDGRVLPAGANIQAGIWQVHHNDEIWDSPFEFDPDRFSQENSVGRHPFAFVPFSAGPRNCIGQQFAMNEMKTCMALILRNFKLTTAPGKIPQPVTDLIRRSSNGIWLNIEAIK